MASCPITAISVCAGVGMLDHGIDIALGGSLRPILYVEREAFAGSNLASQMEAGFLAAAPVWSDLRTLTSAPVRAVVGKALRGRGLDLLFGGIPCQPYSQAGKRLGADDERDLWPATRRAIEVYAPRFLFIENVSGFLRQEDGAYRVVRDLEEMGYRVELGLFSSSEAGASHGRKRCFVLAMADTARDVRDRPHGQSGWRGRVRQGGEVVADPNSNSSRQHAGELQGHENQDWPEHDHRAECRCERLAHPTGRRRREARTQECGRERRSPIAFGCAELANSHGRRSSERWRTDDARQPGSTRRSEGMADPDKRGREGERCSGKLNGERTPCRNDADGCSGADELGDADNARLQGRTTAPFPRREKSEQRCQELPRYAPGQDSALWQWISENRADLLPTEPRVRGMVDGVAPWADRLRAVGNGVDSLVAAYAFISLFAALCGGDKGQRTAVRGAGG